MNIHARTEPHSRYAIFFIQSGGQVKNIVLNIILYTTAAEDTFIRDTRVRLKKYCPRYHATRSLVITMEFEQRDRNCTEPERCRAHDVRFTKCCQLETKSFYFKFARGIPATCHQPERRSNRDFLKCRARSIETVDASYEQIEFADLSV